MSNRASVIDPDNFAAIKPRAWYPLTEVAKVFNVSLVTARRRTKAKGSLLTSKRHPLDARKLIVLGSSILDAVGPFFEGDLPPQRRHETPMQRKARARRAMEDIKRMTSGSRKPNQR